MIKQRFQHIEVSYTFYIIFISSTYIPQYTTNYVYIYIFKNKQQKLNTVETRLRTLASLTL
jgi:hypothetical protein